MSLTTFFYSLKVWLSAVFIAPLLLFIGRCLNMDFRHMDISEMLGSNWKMYEIFLIFGAAFSFIIWLIFLLAIMIAMKSTDSSRRRKLIVSIIAVTLAIGTFTVFFCLFGIYPDRYSFFITLSYSICIGAGSFYYKLEAEEQPRLETSPIEQTN